jgi:VanZ family protein
MIGRACQLATWVSLAIVSTIVAYYAFYPGAHHPRLLRWDKAEHILAFTLLSVLSFAAFPRARIWVVPAALLAAGAAIEMIQMTALVRRDGEFADWLFDALAILAVTGIRAVLHFASSYLARDG